ncbi:MAG: hypothetical protein JXQ72_00895 [Anaerolineae bacterium]|nr:hypothetical protein [Anaerolineae bacterium]
MDDIETLWANILSRDADRIRATWDALNAEEKTAVRAHLTRMVTEPDWSEPQRISAQAALDALENGEGE